jgi:hypothetical protein
MSFEDFVKLGEKIFYLIKLYTPIDTGNLRYNAVRLTLVDMNTIKITVDENIAPYMVYTNEPWISPRWNGRQNPNEHWWNNVIEKSIVEFIEQYYGIKAVVGAKK